MCVCVVAFGLGICKCEYVGGVSERWVCVLIPCVRDCSYAWVGGMCGFECI